MIIPVPSLAATGDRVWVHTARETDVPAYQEAVRRSAARIGRWNPVNPGDLRWHLDRQSDEHRTFLIHAHEPRGSHGIVGKVNVTNVVRGRFQSGVIGYDSYDPYVGERLFAEGLALIVGIAFTEAPRGMGLHRIEANVRPGNGPSSGVLRSLGFRREGYVRDMLLLPAEDGTAWRDHVMHAVTRDEWPSPAYSPNRWPVQSAVVVGADAATLDVARRLAEELGVPLLAEQEVARVVDGAGARRDLLVRLSGDSPIGAVLQIDPSHEPQVRERLAPGVPVIRLVQPGSTTASDDGDIVLDPDRSLDARVITAVALAIRERCCS